MTIQDKIQKIKEQKNAVILAHNYQIAEIQDLADFTGDSLELAKKAQDTDADIILFCGVDFMAETAKILNPTKKVLVPNKYAICPMAAQLTANDLKLAKKENPGAKVVLYINTTAESKTEADCICTSSNAVDVVNALDCDTILFGPDSNLADYVQQFTDKKIIPIPENGGCITHQRIVTDYIERAKEKYPNAKVIAHPECLKEVRDVADYITSTSKMLTVAKQDPAKEFIIATEIGLLHKLRQEVPNKKIVPATHIAVCANMKRNTMEGVLDALENETNEVFVDEETAQKAKQAINAMMAVTYKGVKK